MRYLSECTSDNTVIRLVSGQITSEGETYTVYGLHVRMLSGEEYRCEDVSCCRDEVEVLIRRLQSAPFLFEELPYLVEDHIAALSEYIP